MADAATVVMQTTILPDEVAKTISATTTVTPKDANDKWYYKLTSVTAASTDLIQGYYGPNYTPINANANPATVATTDKVEFLYVKNTDSANDIYITVGGTTASNSAVGAIKLSPNESWYGRLPNSTVADVNAIGYDPVGAAAAAATAIVAALLDDV